jgi:hypothetical protein
MYSLTGLPPLFKVKSTLRFLQLLKKSGGYEKLIELNRYLFSLLESEYFEIVDDIIYLKDGVFLEDMYGKLRHLMLERGLYLPVSPHEPFFVSLAHDERLLSKCAGLMNSIINSIKGC